MGLFDMFKSDSGDKMSPHLAFATALLYMMSADGEMDTCIVLRTAIVSKGRIHVQAGAGIVADSVPVLEWEETLNKRRAMFRAVALAEQTPQS